MASGSHRETCQYNETPVKNVGELTAWDLCSQAGIAPRGSMTEQASCETTLFPPCGAR